MKLPISTVGPNPTADDPVLPSRFHGEYKVPGGKLVVVDFAVRDGALSEVQISGDFFLFPEEALHRLHLGLERSPVNVAKDERAALIHASLAEGDELIGLTSDAVAIAIDRALSESR